MPARCAGTAKDYVVIRSQHYERQATMVVRVEMCRVGTLLWSKLPALAMRPFVPGNTKSPSSPFLLRIMPPSIGISWLLPFDLAMRSRTRTAWLNPSCPSLDFLLHEICSRFTSPRVGAPPGYERIRRSCSTRRTETRNEKLNEHLPRRSYE